MAKTKFYGTGRRKTGSIKQSLSKKEPLVINGVHFLCRKEHMPCWNSCHLLKKQPFLQNMSFLTAGFPLQAPYIPLRKLGMMSSE